LADAAGKFSGDEVKLKPCCNFSVCDDDGSFFKQQKPRTGVHFD
jgi:hypothetical protein